MSGRVDVVAEARRLCAELRASGDPEDVAFADEVEERLMGALGRRQADTPGWFPEVSMFAVGVVASWVASRRRR